MSLALQALTPIVVNDPRIIQQPRLFPVLKGGQEVLYKRYTTTSVSQSSITFSCPPPSQLLYTDRRIHLSLPVRLTLTATGVDPNQYILNPNQCCLRAYPISQAMDTIQMTLNNQSLSINMGDVISAMSHFNIDRKLRAIDYSKCPTYGTHQAQDFTSLFGANRSCMSLYGDGLDGLAPQAFPFTIVSQENDNNGVGTSTAKTVVDFVSTEPLFLSPLYWGSFDDNDSAFFGLRTFDINFNFLNNGGNRMIAIDKDSVGVAYNPTTFNTEMQFSGFAGGFSYADNVPRMLFQYLTPQATDTNVGLNKILNYPYFNVERFPTDLGQQILPGVQTTITSNNIQLNSIPSKMYMFVRKRNQDLNSDPFSPDTFFQINNLSLQWGNRNGVLSSADARQLYDLAVKNGCTLSWAAWSGEKMNAPALASAGFGTPAQQYSGSGGIVALDPIDLGLNDISSPGKLEQMMLQAQIVVTNVSNNPINATFYVVVISQGIFSIYNGQSSAMIGVLTSDNILKAHKQTGHAMISYADVRRVNGGNFLSDVKNKLMSIWSKVKPYVGPAMAIAKEVAPLLGLGEGGNSGGVRANGVRAGAKIPRRKLKNRLK